MKMKKRWIAAAAVLSMLVLPCQAAEEIAVTARYIDGKIEIEGQVENAPMKALTLQIYSADKTGLTTEDIQQGQGIQMLIYTDANGAFERAFGLGENYDGGKYMVKVMGDEGQGSTELMYVSATQAAQVISQLNQAAGQEEFGQIIAENMEVLGIDEEEYTEKAQVVSQVLYQQKPSGGYDVNSFTNGYQCACCIYELTQESAELDELLERYGEYIGQELSQEVMQQSQDVQQMLRQRLAGEDYSALTLTQAVEQNLLLSQLLCAQRYPQLQEIMEENLEELGYDLSGYNQVKDKDNVYKKMFGSLSQLDSYSDLETLFQQAVDEALQEEEEDGTGGGSGGSGGGSSGGGGSGSGGRGNVVSSISGSGEAPKFEPEQADFSDLEGHWAKDTVEQLADEGVISGFEDGTFRPDQSVTRAEFTKMIVQAFSLSAGDKSVSFTDVAADAWYAQPISIAAGSEIILGSDGAFSPNEEITRQDAAMILQRTAEKLGISLSGEESFADQEQIAPYARQAVALLAGSGILHGDGGYFRPIDTTTRAEAATMIFRLQQAGGVGA